jgi:hypothetical protein
VLVVVGMVGLLGPAPPERRGPLIRPTPPASS